MFVANILESYDRAESFENSLSPAKPAQRILKSQTCSAVGLWLDCNLALMLMGDRLNNG